jgi:hypothetical protein
MPVEEKNNNNGKPCLKNDLGKSMVWPSIKL